MSFPNSDPIKPDCPMTSRVLLNLRTSIVLAMVLFFAHSSLRACDLSCLATRFPELKFEQAEGLPVRFAREDWDRAREVVRTDKAWKTWLDRTRSRLDQWMQRPAERPEWVIGSMHDYFDPATGQAMQWSEQATEPEQVDAGSRRLHAAWVAWNRYYNVQRVLEATRLHQLTGETKYADWAAEQLDFYSKLQSVAPAPPNTRPTLFMQLLDEAAAISSLTPSARLLRRHVSPERFAEWQSGLFYPVARRLMLSRAAASNVVIWYGAAIAEIGLLFEDEELLQYGLHGERGIKTILNKGVTDDSIWFEGSFGYQTYVVRALTPLFIEASLAGRGHELLREMLIAQNMTLAPAVFRFDDGFLPTPGDATARLRGIDPNLLSEVHRVLPTYPGVQEANRKPGWNALIDPVPLNADLTYRLPPVQTRHFSAIRMAVLKSDVWQVFMRYGQLSPYHNRQDALNIEIYQGSVPVSTTPPTVLYGSRFHKNYFQRAVSHNVPLVDGEGQRKWSPGAVRSFSTAPPQIEVVQEELLPDITAVRRTGIDGSLLTDRLRVTARSTARRLGFLLHADCLIEGAQNTAAAPSPPPVGPGFEFWGEIQKAPMDSTRRFLLRCEDRHLHLDLASNVPGQLYVAKAPSSPPSRQRQVFYFEALARDATFESRLSPTVQP